MTSRVMNGIVFWWAPIPETNQESFLDDDTPDAAILFSGGWGAGKTMTLTAKVLKLSAINHPVPGIWVVPNYDHIVKTIIPLLTSQDHRTGEHWFLAPDQFHHHKTEHTLTWAGGTIWFKSAEHAAAIAGPSVAWAAVDEPGSIEQDAWRNTVARVRHPGAKLRQTVASGTPEGLGWMSDLFFDPERPGRYKVYHMSTRDNRELPQDYVAQVSENATEAEIQSYVDGIQTNLTGALAHPVFDEALHWTPRVELDPLLPLRLSFDFNVNPMICIVGQQTMGLAGMEAHVVDTVAKYSGDLNTTCDEILERYPRWEPGVVIYGDATGRARHVKDLRSNYEIIRARLKTIGRIEEKVPLANPAVVERLNAVNVLLMNAKRVTRLWIRKTEPARSCHTRELVRSLQRTKKPDGTATKVEKKPGETITHASEALGYWIAKEFPVQKPRVQTGSMWAEHLL